MVRHDIDIYNVFIYSYIVIFYILYVRFISVNNKNMNEVLFSHLVLFYEYNPVSLSNPGMGDNS